MNIVELDRNLTLALNNIHCQSSDSFWLFMSSNKVVIPVYILGIVLLFWSQGWKKGLIYTLVTALVLVLGDQICNLVKNNVCRLRPSFDQDMLDRGLVVLQNSRKSHCYGFFSAHSALSFAFACCSSRFASPGWTKSDNTRNEKSVRLIVRCYTVFIYIWAVLVALSRVFLGKHFIGDILTGALFGILLSYFVIYLLSRIQK